MFFSRKSKAAAAPAPVVAPVIAPVVSPLSATGEPDIVGLGRLLWSKKSTILGFTLMAAAAAFVVVNAITPRYRSESRLLLEVREELETPETPVVVSGNIGPRGDGYKPEARMSEAEARTYHAQQIGTFAATDADMLGAFTMNYVEEAVGIALAARDARMPLALSFTLETDGRLPTGETLCEAIETVDRATRRSPTYYMINCAHPSHFGDALEDGATWTQRVHGIRANASRKSHAELDNSTELDAGDPHELGQLYAELRRRFPYINVLGGCCGTDHRHVQCISASCHGHVQSPTSGPHGSRRGRTAPHHEEEWSSP